MISNALLDTKSLLQKLKTDKEGLSEKEANKRLKEYGKNELKKKREFTTLKILAGQFTSFLVIILIVAGLISFFIGEILDATGIFAIVLINGVIGFFQEYKAENSVKALKKLVTDKAVIVRDGRRIEIDASLLVPGDIVVIEEGMKVPADLRVIESFSIKADEAILTGESLPVYKKVQNTVTKQNFKGGVLFSNTMVVSGSGLGVVYATGMSTEFGKIAELVMIHEKDETLLNKQMNELAKKLGGLIIVLILILFILGLFRGIDFIHMFNIAVSLGVSAIPEGLPIIVTLTLALGVQTIAKQKAIVRKMSVVEALGAATVICSDKTGTLTMNEMTVKKVFVDGKETNIAGVGYNTLDKIILHGRAGQKLLDVCENCNNSYVEFDKKGLEETVLGDPTEIALKVFARKGGNKDIYEKVDEYAFTSERKLMSTVHAVGNGKEVFMKGAPEEVLNHCIKILINGKIMNLTSAKKEVLLKRNAEWGRGALRVLGIAYKKSAKTKPKETEMIFLGLVGMNDPPRKEVMGAIATAQKAGIKIKIITGDNPVTTKAIAESIGLKVDKIYEGYELDAMSYTELKEVIANGNIFARTSPKHKHRIVSMLKDMGEVVAVTGDGVNDAPALKKADIGIAMGIKGTQVSKEASDIILQDDNFATIVTIIGEGRRVYSNILSFVKFMLSANFDTIAAVGILTIAGAPLPILALQVLWINIATDSLPALALGAEKAEKGIMKNKPHKKGEHLLKKFALFIGIATIIQIIANLVLFQYGFMEDQLIGINTFDLSVPSHARTMIFTGIVMFELFLVFNCRGIKKSLLNGGLLINKKLVAAVVTSFALQLVIVYHPFMQEMFKTVPLEPIEWVVIALLAAPALVLPQVIEFIKKLNPTKTAKYSS